MPVARQAGHGNSAPRIGAGRPRVDGRCPPRGAKLLVATLSGAAGRTGAERVPIA
jgi:hypothetical protein